MWHHTGHDDEMVSTSRGAAIDERRYEWIGLEALEPSIVYDLRHKHPDIHGGHEQDEDRPVLWRR